MAQRVNIVLVDDMDGTEADETVQFGLDGYQYEIDLTAKHATKLRDMLAPYIGSARKVRSRAGRARASDSSKSTTATPKRGGTRKRVATVEEIEASKAKAETKADTKGAAK